MANSFSKELTLNEWLKHWGWQWVEGREQLYKGSMGVLTAADLVADLRHQGVITYAQS